MAAAGDARPWPWLGIVFGACLEQLSSMIGLRALSWVALGLYAFAVLSTPKTPGRSDLLGSERSGDRGTEPADTITGECSPTL